MAENPLSAIGEAGKKIGGVIGDFAAHLREGDGGELKARFGAVRDHLLDIRNADDLKAVGPKIDELFDDLKDRVRDAAEGTETEGAKQALRDAAASVREMLDKAVDKMDKIPGEDGSATATLRARLDEILEGGQTSTGRHARQDPAPGAPEIIDGEVVDEDPSN